MALAHANASRFLRSEGICDTVVDALQGFGLAPRSESLAALAASFGFDGLSYVRLGGAIAHPRLLDHWTSYGPSWTSRYAARGYHLVDPRVTMTRNRAVPVTWGEHDGRQEPRTLEFLQDAGRQGLRGGVAWSAFDARVGRVVVAWDSKHAPGTSPLGRGLGTIALLAGVVHEALAVHCTPTPAGPGKAPLTDRERECVALVARGMTSADVGVKLGITTRTANFHIGNVMSKLGAVNRGEAIARAVSANLVSLD